MKLIICLITYNRLAYTKKTFKSLRETLQDQYYLVVVDNNSTDGTREWLTERRKNGSVFDRVILNPDNYYPGKACNIGWEAGLKDYPDATHLMRLDNDMKLLPGWYDRAGAYFDAFPNLGQLGLDHGPQVAYPAESKLPEWTIESNGLTVSKWPGNVGGTNIITREVWDKGIRYDETPWPESPNPRVQEDCKLSIAIDKAGYQFGHMTDRLAHTIDQIEDYPEYFRKTFTERGYDEMLGHIPND